MEQDIIYIYMGIVLTSCLCMMGVCIYKQSLLIDKQHQLIIKLRTQLRTHLNTQLNSQLNSQLKYEVQESFGEQEDIIQ